MQDYRDDQNQAYNDPSRKRADRPYLGYSALPGPSFDAGRYASNERQDLNRNVYPSENRNRSFGEHKGGFRDYRDNSGSYERQQQWRSQDQRRDFDDRNRRSQPDFYEMGGYGNSSYNSSYGQESRDRSEPAYGKHNSSSGSSMNRGRDYNRDYGQLPYGGRGYGGPAYGSIPTGGRHDSDRDFTSGGITNMGGDYDREHRRGRQYQENYDSAGTYIGDYDQDRSIRYGSQGQDHNQYNSDFTFGSGTAGRPDYGNFNSGDRYGYRNEDQFRSPGAGNSRGGFSRRQDNDRYSNRDTYRAGNWSQQSSQQGNYRERGTNTGNPEYDRRNRMSEDYNRQRSNHPDEDRGFLEQAGDRLRSWFGGHEHDRHRR